MTDEEQSGLAALTERRDTIELALGDSLDVKANIWLVLITFLAALDGGLLHAREGRALTAIVLFSTIFLALFGIATILSLWPRTYEYPPLPQAVAEWLVLADREAPGTAAALMKSKLLDQGSDRIDANRRVNRIKSACLVWAYGLLLPSLILTVGVLLVLAARLVA